MRHVWSVLCQETRIEKPSTKLSLIDIPEVFTIYGDPVGMAPPGSKIFVRVALTVASLFWVEVDNDPGLDLRIWLITPGGLREDYLKKSPDISGQGHQKDNTLSLLVTFEGFSFDGFGVYAFDLFMRPKRAKRRWTRAASIPFNVRLATASDPAASDSPALPPRTSVQE
jgi:hypothetical protein